MLVTPVNVISCENPRCREFARIVSGASGARFYYCPVCGTVSSPREVDAGLATDLPRCEAYLRRVILSEGKELKN